MPRMHTSHTAAIQLSSDQGHSQCLCFVLSCCEKILWLYQALQDDYYFLIAPAMPVDGFFTELCRQLADVQELSATEGIQLLQDCIMVAAQNTYQKAKSANYQPKDKPFFDDECRVALRQYEEALQDATSHVAKYFLKRFRAVVRRKKHHYTKHTSAKLMDLAQRSPAKLWKRFRKKVRSVPVADLDKWMAHFEKLLNVPRSDDYVDSQCLLFTPQIYPVQQR